VKVLCLTILIASAVWADETTDRAGIEATVAALNISPSQPNLFTGDFADIDKVQQFLGQAATLTVSREPMGEATIYLPRLTRFVTRSVTVISPDTSVVVAIHERQFKPTESTRVPVLFVLKREGSDWHIASFRVLAEATISKNVP
jgi:hypothetical protein